MFVSFEDLREVIAQQFERDADSITMDTAFQEDLDADSLDMADLYIELSDQLGIPELAEIEYEEAEALKTVGDLYQYIQEHQPKS